MLYICMSRSCYVLKGDSNESQVRGKGDENFAQRCKVALGPKTHDYKGQDTVLNSATQSTTSTKLQFLV